MPTNYETLERLADQLAILPREICATLRIHPKTLKRWKITKRCPFYAVTLLEMKHAGIRQEGRWRDWRIDERGALVAPDGREFWPDQLMNLHYLQPKQRSVTVQARWPALSVRRANRWRVSLLPVRALSFSPLAKRPS